MRKVNCAYLTVLTRLSLRETEVNHGHCQSLLLIALPKFEPGSSLNTDGNGYRYCSLIIIIT
jgi:hypothetical protein